MTILLQTIKLHPRLWQIPIYQGTGRNVESTLKMIKKQKSPCPSEIDFDTEKLRTIKRQYQI
jgi:hypothetical protein